MFKHGFHVVVGLGTVAFKICSSLEKTAKIQKTEMNLFFQVVVFYYAFNLLLKLTEFENSMNMAAVN